MNAVNLIPPEHRRTGAAGASLATWGILAGLALVLVGVLGYVLAGNQIADRKADLAGAKIRNASVQRQLAALKPYRDFAALEQARVATVRGLAATRFDWERALRDLARVTTPDVWLQSLNATLSPDVSVSGGAAGATGGTSLRSALPDPAVEIAGCATSNDAVVRYVTRLRAMTGVLRVSLADSQKPDSATSSSAPTGGSGASTADTSGTCGRKASQPAFSAVVFYTPPAVDPAVAAAATASSTTPTTSTTSSSGSGG